MTHLSSYPWHICGVGAIGSLWASALIERGVPVTLLLKDTVCIYDYPNADFSANPQPANVTNPEVTFTNTSYDNTINKWTFAGGLRW